MVYAPDRDWADLVITEMSMFPVGRYKDLTDSASQEADPDAPYGEP
jgi:hypothetical protein